MGTEDMRRQRPNVERMGLLGARGRAGRGRRAHAQGGGQRGDPRLGHERRDDALRDRVGGRAGALPGARARPPARDRRRGARAGAGAGRAPAGRVSSPAWAAAATRSAPSSPFLADEDVELVGVEAGGEGLDSGRHGASLGAGGRACCTARCPRCSRTRTARSWRRTRSPPGSTTRASAPSTRSCATAGACATSPSPTTQALAAFRELSRLEGIIPALEPAHAIAWVLARTRRRTDAITLVTLSGRGDKDLAEVLRTMR